MNNFLDNRIFLSINSFAKDTTFFHSFAKLWGISGGAIFLVVLLVSAYLISYFKTPTDVLKTVNEQLQLVLTAGSALIALGFGQIISHLVKRPRPWQTFPHALILAGHQHDFSFPSDHVTLAGALSVGLCFSMHKRICLIALINSLFLGFLRIYIGAHFPSDVLGGYILGGLCAFIILRYATQPLFALIKPLIKPPFIYLVIFNLNGTKPKTLDKQNEFTQNV